MATRAKGETEKVDTNTNSNSSPRSSLLREDAPQLRTVDAILKKNEQILDGLERGVLTPKMGEQMGQCIKTPQALVKIEIAYHRMIQNYGRRVPVPRSPLLRSMIPGLNPDKVAPTDGETVRALIGEEK